MRGLPPATIRPSQNPANWLVTMDSSTSEVKKFSLMRCAPNATEASTMPGPPRAFIATARFLAAAEDSPASRAPSQTLADFTRQASARNQQKNTGSKWRTRSSLMPTIAK
ncbi:hypothetical protein GCM10023100_13430 [Actinocorallia cavernae]|uniref:Uncharacterized protein n=1 Tax=Actinocorallia cavernae TaxID=328075 RepID=A0ABP8SCG7_9ACTN